MCGLCLCCVLLHQRSIGAAGAVVIGAFCVGLWCVLASKLVPRYASALEVLCVFGVLVLQP